jgi:ATP-dependent metalloprotease
LARLSSGFSGADIKNLINLAILNAIKNNTYIATMNNFDHAFDRIRMGV